MRSKNHATLSALENKVMRVVWQQGQATAEAVRTALMPAASLKDSTVRTVLRRLEQKGFVTHRSMGRTYVYSAKIAPLSAAATAVRGIIQRLCNGSVEDLLLGMVDHELLSPDTLQAIAERVEAAKTKSMPHAATKKSHRSHSTPS
jgi:predicted transcriptional regulator